MRIEVQKSIRFIIAFSIFYGYSSLKRGPFYLLSSLSFPLSLLFLLYIITQGYFIRYGIIGGLLSLIASIAISEIGDYVLFRKEIKLQDLLVATGITPLEYILGISLGNIIFSLPAIIFYIILGIIFEFLNIIQILDLIGISMLLMIGLSSFSFLIATYIKYTRYAWGVAGLVSILFSVIPPLYYPYQILGNYVYFLLPILSTPAGILVQEIIESTSFRLEFLLVFIIETIIYVILAIKLARWSEV